MGSSAENKETLADVHLEATKAIRLVDAFAPMKPTPAARRTTEHNAHSVKQSGEERYHAQMRRGLRCLHCGDPHYPSDCPVYASGKPQTPNGMRAWAELQARQGTSRNYDAKEAYEYSVRKKAEFASLNGTARVGQHRPRRRRLIRDDEEEVAEVAAPAAAPPGAPAASARPNRNGARESAYNSMEVVDDGSEWEADATATHIIQLHDVHTQALDKEDGTTATSMCLRIEMNGVPVGPALIDQGANRSIMRRSAFERAGLDQVTTLWKINNYQVKTASNHLIPITGRFMANITSNGESFNDEAVVYVVDDVTDRGKDISCDVVVGRHTIANSDYRLLDTLHARLVKPDEPAAFLQCQTCAPKQRNDGKADLDEQRQDVTNGPVLANSVPIMTIAVERRPLQRRDCQYLHVVEQLQRSQNQQ
jgi:hypothetical protein